MPSYPEVQSTVVIWDLTLNKLRYFSDEVSELLSGKIIQISTDTGNQISVGTDGGLVVPKALSESGTVSTVSGTTNIFSQAIVFAETYIEIPVVTFSSEYVSGILPLLRYESLTLTGFTLHIDEVTGANLNIGNHTWKTN